MKRGNVKKDKTKDNALSNNEEIDNQLASGPPVDYSYKKIKSLKDFKEDHPRSARVGRTPARGPNHRFLSRSLWLSNNDLLDLDGLSAFVNNTFEQPHILGWLDVSSNYFNTIPKEITEFVNLRVLYLHNNIIDQLVYVKRLVPLKDLCCLTLLGNPIEDNFHYKNFILYFLPKLKNLDYASILAYERKVPRPPHDLLEEQEPTPFTGTEEEMLAFINSEKI